MNSAQQEIETMKQNMKATGYRQSPSPNFGWIYESLDGSTSVEVTRAGEWMLYRHDGMNGVQLDHGDCAAKLFLSMLSHGCPYDC